MTQDQKARGKVEPPNLQSEEIRQDASDGPRRKREGKNYDGSSPLSSPGHEALAQYLAAPKSLRKFRSDIEFAKHFQVTRMTVYRWKQNPEVIERAFWLSAYNQMIGDLRARQEWPRIMEKVVEMATKGDIQAIKFCESRAWAEKLQVTQSQLSASILIEDLLGTCEGNESEKLQTSSLKTEGDTR
jgi:hypothetical protein